MNLRDDQTPEQPFEEAWKLWVERPTQQTPAEAAARIAGLMRTGRQRRRPFWMYAAAAAVLLAAIGIMRMQFPRRAAPDPTVQSIQEAVPLGEGQVLLWLDSDTPLYMTYQ